MKKLSIIALILAIIALGYVIIKVSGNKSFGSAASRESFSSAKVTQITIASSSATSTLSGMNANRIYLYLQRVSGADVTCSPTSTVTYGNGWQMTSSTQSLSYLEFSGATIYDGQIWCISNWGAATLISIEGGY